jgi:hypothetical protein
MQWSKRGNHRRKPRNRKRSSFSANKPLKRVRLSLHETDPITGDEKALYTLINDCYQGYTIYSTKQGRCCIHGAGRQGCLRIQGKFASFPGVEDDKNMIKYFRANKYTSADSMERSIPEGDEHVHILNAPSTEPIGCA